MFMPWFHRSVAFGYHDFPGGHWQTTTILVIYQCTVRVVNKGFFLNIGGHFTKRLQSLWQPDN